MKNITKFVLVIFGGFSISFTTRAQQDSHFSQYMFNTMAINPAYAGSRDVLNVTLLGRYQWSGVEGAPNTATLTADMPYYNEKIGVGGSIFQDNIGLIRSTGAYFTYAQRVKLTKLGTLSFGGTLGATFYNANLQNALTYQKNDPNFAESVSGIKPNLGLGIYYSSDNWYLGISMPRVYNNNLSASGKNKQSRHFFGMTGFVWHINPIVVVKPSILLKQVHAAPLQADFNINVWFYDKISLGMSYRTGDACVGMIELIPAQKWRIGYAYDFTVSGLTNYLTQGSHEIMLRHEFAGVRSMILSPRYF